MNTFNRVFFSVVIVHLLVSNYLFQTAYEMAVLGALLYFILGGYTLIAIWIIVNGYYLFKNKWKISISFRWFDYILLVLPVAGLIYVFTYW